MKRIFIRPLAWADIEAQALFIAQDNPRAAYQLYDACHQTFNKLARMPQMGQLYPTGKKELIGIRFFPILDFEKHLVFYVPDKNQIDIVRILYASRDINRILHKT